MVISIDINIKIQFIKYFYLTQSVYKQLYGFN